MARYADAFSSAVALQPGACAARKAIRSSLRYTLVAAGSGGQDIAIIVESFS